MHYDWYFDVIKIDIDVCWMDCIDVFYVCKWFVYVL